jgi:hypothetical protein
MYGAISGSKIQENPFLMMLWHNDTSLWPMSKTLRYAYTTFSLHNVMFWKHGWALCLNDITFRLHYRTFPLQSRPLHALQNHTRIVAKCHLNAGLSSRGKRVKMTQCYGCTEIVTPDIAYTWAQWYILYLYWFIKTWPTANMLDQLVFFITFSPHYITIRRRIKYLQSLG